MDHQAVDGQLLKSKDRNSRRPEDSRTLRLLMVDHSNQRKFFNQTVEQRSTVGPEQSTVELKMVNRY